MREKESVIYLFIRSSMPSIRPSVKLMISSINYFSILSVLSVCRRHTCETWRTICPHTSGSLRCRSSYPEYVIRTTM